MWDLIVLRRSVKGRRSSWSAGQEQCAQRITRSSVTAHEMRSRLMTKQPPPKEYYLESNISHHRKECLISLNVAEHRLHIIINNANRNSAAFFRGVRTEKPFWKKTFDLTRGIYARRIKISPRLLIIDNQYVSCGKWHRHLHLQPFARLT